MQKSTSLIHVLPPERDSKKLRSTDQKNGLILVNLLNILPAEIWSIIYQYDNTYHETYKALWNLNSMVEVNSMRWNFFHIRCSAGIINMCSRNKINLSPSIRNRLSLKTAQLMSFVYKHVLVPEAMRRNKLDGSCYPHPWVKIPETLSISCHSDRLFFDGYNWVQNSLTLPTLTEFVDLNDFQQNKFNVSLSHHHSTTQITLLPIFVLDRREYLERYVYTDENPLSNENCIYSSYDDFYIIQKT
jgi:hypothetical protein